MNIDWFTLIAQIVNFLVLVALLRWLLYGRILLAMNQREEKIANRLNEAEQKKQNAQTQASQYEEKLRQLDQQRDELLKDARQKADQEHNRLLKQAREDVDQRRRQWEEELRRGRDDLATDLRHQAGKMGVEAARRALAQLADAGLEKRMLDVFVSQLRQLSEEKREEIASHLGDGKAKISVRTAFEVPDDGRKQLREAVADTFDFQPELSFEKATNLICGVELDLGGFSFGWNVKDYLQQLEFDFDQRLKFVG